MVSFVEMKLSLLAILLGAGMGLPQVYGVLKPAGLAAAARRFPRNLPAGIVLMLLATAWFAWNVNNEPIADFSASSPTCSARSSRWGFCRASSSRIFWPCAASRC